jgi:hypothetical protein
MSFTLVATLSILSATLPIQQAPQVAANPLRAGVRGDDLRSIDEGFLVVGWETSETPRPYVALVDPGLTRIAWEAFPSFTDEAILIAMSRDEVREKNFAVGHKRHAPDDNLGPLVLAFDDVGGEIGRWAPNLGENHALWDVEVDPGTGDLIVVGETRYHEEGSNTYAARLTSDLQLVWQSEFSFDPGRSAGYALAATGTDFILGGSASAGQEEEATHHPMLLRFAHDGRELERRLFRQHRNALYHWVRISEQRIFAGGYGRRDGRPATDTFFEVLDMDLTQRHSEFFGGDRDDRTIHSFLCGDRLVFGGFSQSHSEQGWRGLVVETPIGEINPSTTIVRHADDAVAIRNFACDPRTDRSVYIGYSTDSDGRVTMIGGFIEH